MIQCSHCGRENKDDHKFCLSCGSPLPRVEAPPEPTTELIPCPHCQSMVPPNFKFCGECGGAIHAPAQVTAPAPELEQTSAPFAQPLHARPGFERQGTDSQIASPGAPKSAPRAPATSAKLVIIRPDGSEGASVPIRDGEVMLGRASEENALRNDPFLSPDHARVTRRDGRFLIEDLSSLNGIYYRIRADHELRHDDFIRVGQELLQFHFVDQLEPEGRGADETELGGSPDVGYWGRLSLINGPEIVTRAFMLSDDEIHIGREIGDILFREDGFVSGRHARITKIGQRALLKDAGSSNGTYVRIDGSRELEQGDLILMGQQLFRLGS